MRVRKRSRSWLFAILVSSLMAVVVGPTPTHCQEGLRIDLAPDAVVKISNQFGSVSLETWKQHYVVVSATVPDGQKAPATSPIVIDNRKNLLLVSVVRRPIDPVLVINLEVKVPESTRLDVTTTAGAINLKGMSSGAV